jgi:glucokinase
MLLLAIDVGGTNSSVALIADDGTVIERERRPTDRAGGRDWMLERIEAGCRGLIQRAPERPAACGIGFGGPVDFPNQRIQRSMHVGGWAGFRLSEHLAGALGVPCVVDNDANTAALGEYAFGAGRGARSMACLTVSTGVGGGLVLNGEVYRGPRSFAGEFGHTPLVPNGPPCACGRRGCVEAVCSGEALGRDARRAAQLHPRAWSALIKEAGRARAIEAKTVFDGARRGHPAAKALVERYCDDFGRGLAGLIALLDLDCVVLGGGVSLAGPVLFAPLRRAIARHMPPFLPRSWRCLPAALGSDYVLCGAAQLALRYTAMSQDPSPRSQVPSSKSQMGGNCGA